MIDTLEQDLVDAGCVRLPSVLLTAAATVFDVLPLATGYDRKVSISIGATIFL